MPIKEYYHTTDECVVINQKLKLFTPKCRNAGTLLVEYKIYGGGEIEVDYCYKNLKFKNVPRLGITFEMPKNFNKVKYYGYDKTSLSDFKEQAVFAISQLDVRDMHDSYIKPQKAV